VEWIEVDMTKFKHEYKHLIDNRINKIWRVKQAHSMDMINKIIEQQYDSKFEANRMIGMTTRAIELFDPKKIKIVNKKGDNQDE
jgi:hypothetical protein